MISDIQRGTIQAIIRLFETGTPIGDHSAVVVLPDRAGISYGVVQATLASGNLYRLLNDYFLPVAPEQDRAAIAPYLPAIRLRDARMNNNENLRVLLRTLGRTPAMQAAQNRFAREVFLDPAERIAAARGWVHALSVGVICDSLVQGGWGIVSPLVDVDRSNEQAWIREYVDRRLNWLARHPRRILRQTVYRPHAWRQLIQANNWDLHLPIVVRGARLTEEIARKLI